MNKLLLPTHLKISVNTSLSTSGRNFQSACDNSLVEHLSRIPSRNHNHLILANSSNGTRQSLHFYKKYSWESKIQVSSTISIMVLPSCPTLAKLPWHEQSIYLCTKKQHTWSSDALSKFPVRFGFHDKPYLPTWNAVLSKKSQCKRNYSRFWSKALK